MKRAAVDVMFRDFVKEYGSCSIAEQITALERRRDWLHAKLILREDEGLPAGYEVLRELFATRVAIELLETAEAYGKATKDGRK